MSLKMIYFVDPLEVIVAWSEARHYMSALIQGSCVLAKGTSTHGLAEPGIKPLTQMLTEMFLIS